MTKLKIKINDDRVLRNTIDEIYAKKTKDEIIKWALMLARHTVYMLDINLEIYIEIEEGFKTNELWQEGKLKMYDVRISCFKIHEIAKNEEDEVLKNGFRVIGQALSSVHMKEHAMVASDYLIKVINIIYPDDINKVKEERMWQLSKIKEL